MALSAGRCGSECVEYSNIDNVSMLCDVGVLKPTKIGRAYMFSQGMLLKFQHDYEGLNVCNRLRALESKKIVEQRRRK